MGGLRWHIWSLTNIFVIGWYHSQTLRPLQVQVVLAKGPKLPQDGHELLEITSPSC